MQNNFAVWCRTILLASSTPSSKEALARRRPRSYSPACIEHAPAADGCHAMSSRKHYHRAGDTACASEGMNAEQALTRNAQERRASARRGTSYDHCAVRIEGCSANVEPTTDSGERQPAVMRYRPRNRIRFSQTESLPAPEPAYASHSWCTAFVHCKMYVLQHGNVRTTKSGEHQPAVVRYRTGNTERFLPNEDARMPRGAYAPRSWWFCGADICRRN
jgi:hypothetical protein